MIKNAILFKFILLLIISCSSDTEENGTTATTSTDTIETHQELEQYIGIKHPPLPENLTKRGGALAIPSGEEAKNTEYSFTEAFEKDRHLLFLSRLINRNEAGEVTWEIIDVIELPSLAADEQLLIGSCQNSDGDAVAAIAKEEEKETLTNIVKAWTVDRAAGKLKEISNNIVTCENEGFLAP